MLVALFLCWGSFLNVLGYRLIQNESVVLPRSHCPLCGATIAWYDNIPVISWFMLCGKCRSCKKPISLLYPVIELLTAVIMLSLLKVAPCSLFFPYFIFFSALIVTIRSDLETMLISRYVTLLLIPLGFMLSWLGFLQISLVDSILGAFVGYVLLWGTRTLFFWLTKKEGIGQGDLELLAFIGSFTGVIGVWLSLTLGSIIGSIVGLFYLLFTKQGRYAKIPFGPFLALGAIGFVVYLNVVLNSMQCSDPLDALLHMLAPIT